MRRFGALLIILAIFAATAPAWAEDWTLANGKTYKNVVIVAQEDDGVRVTYDGGVGKFPYYELSDDLLLRLGQDPATQAIKRAAVRKQQAEDALKAQQDAAAAAELKKEQAEAAAIANALNPSQAPSTNSTSAQNPASVPGQNPSAASGQNPASAPGQPQPQNPSVAKPGATTANAAAPAPAPTPVVTPPPPVNPLPAPATATADQTPEEQQQQASYPNSKFQYDESSDVSYLDSPAILIVPVAADIASTTGPASAQNAALYLRIVTEGTRAEYPDEVEGVFNSNVPLKGLDKNKKVVFLVDGVYVPTSAPIDAGDNSSDPLPPNAVAFYLTPEHMKALLAGKKVNVSVGSYDYRIDDSGLATFQAFLGDINHLPPASTSFVREYHRFVNRLPSFITMISTACEYIILGAFALVMMASIAAFVMGLTRFIKM